MKPRDKQVNVRGKKEAWVLQYMKENAVHFPPVCGCKCPLFCGGVLLVAAASKPQMLTGWTNCSEKQGLSWGAALTRKSCRVEDGDHTAGHHGHYLPSAAEEHVQHEIPKILINTLIF